MRKSFAECRGEVAKRTANYTKQLVFFFWNRSYIEKPILVLLQLTAMMSRTLAKDSSLLVRGSLVTAIATLTLDPKCQCGIHWSPESSNLKVLKPVAKALRKLYERSSLTCSRKGDWCGIPKKCILLSTCFATPRFPKQCSVAFSQSSE